MTANALAPNIKLYTKHTFSPKELAFIIAYISNGLNATAAVIEAGYHNKRPDKYADISN